MEVLAEQEREGGFGSLQEDLQGQVSERSDEKCRPIGFLGRQPDQPIDVVCYKLKGADTANECRKDVHCVTEPLVTQLISGLTVFQVPIVQVY